MKLILLLVALSTVFSGCNSNSANGNAGKRDTLVIRDTVNVISNHSTGHNTRKEKRYESNAAGNPSSNAASSEPSANASNVPVANQPATNVSQPENPPQKKGWSAAAKDATIGGVAGAAAGALLDRNNRFVGGAIGAAVGSGAGYLIGRARDRKTGRVVKHPPGNTNYNYVNQ